MTVQVLAERPGWIYAARMGRTALTSCVISLALLTATGCSSTPSPKTRLLQGMHKLVPNIPDGDIVSDADEVCAHSQSAARRNLLDDSLAEMEGVDGLALGSAALSRYVDRIIRVAHDVGYCS